MHEQVKERIASWKKFFTRNDEDINEISSWNKILEHLDLDGEGMVEMFALAALNCGRFSKEESLFLQSLPYYTEVIRFLRRLPCTHFGNVFGSVLPNGDRICFLRYPKLEDGQKENVTVNVTIVTTEPVDFDAEIFVFISYMRYLKKNVIIRYATEIPIEFTEEMERCGNAPFKAQMTSEDEGEIPKTTDGGDDLPF